MKHPALCLMLAALFLLLLIPASAEGLPDWQEISDLSGQLLDMARADGAGNAGVWTPQGFVWNHGSAELYMMYPPGTEENELLGASFTGPEAGIRGLTVNATLEDVLECFSLPPAPFPGIAPFLVLSMEDSLPRSLRWARCERNGEEILSLQLAVHEQLRDGIYSDCGIMFFFEDGLVREIRLYGLSALLEARDVLATLDLVKTQSAFFADTF